VAPARFADPAISEWATIRPEWPGTSPAWAFYDHLAFAPA